MSRDARFHVDNTLMHLKARLRSIEASGLSDAEVHHTAQLAPRSAPLTTVSFAPIGDPIAAAHERSGVAYGMAIPGQQRISPERSRALRVHQDPHITGIGAIHATSTPRHVAAGDVVEVPRTAADLPLPQPQVGQPQAGQPQVPEQTHRDVAHQAAGAEAPLGAPRHHMYAPSLADVEAERRARVDGKVAASAPKVSPSPRRDARELASVTHTLMSGSVLPGEDVASALARQRLVDAVMAEHDFVVAPGGSGAAVTTSHAISTLLTSPIAKADADGDESRVDPPTNAAGKELRDVPQQHDVRDAGPARQPPVAAVQPQPMAGQPTPALAVQQSTLVPTGASAPGANRPETPVVVSVTEEPMFTAPSGPNRPRRTQHEVQHRMRHGATASARVARPPVTMSRDALRAVSHGQQQLSTRGQRVEHERHEAAQGYSVHELLATVRRPGLDAAGRRRLFQAASAAHGALAATGNTAKTSIAVVQRPNVAFGEGAGAMRLPTTDDVMMSITELHRAGMQGDVSPSARRTHSTSPRREEETSTPRKHGPLSVRSVVRSRTAPPPQEMQRRRPVSARGRARHVLRMDVGAN